MIKSLFKHFEKDAKIMLAILAVTGLARVLIVLVPMAMVACGHYDFCPIQMSPSSQTELNE